MVENQYISVKEFAQRAGISVQAVYKGLNEETVKDYVQCNTTPVAYERLINKEVDAIFGAEPSKSQLEMAKKAGVELELIPLGREAFVFLVNKVIISSFNSS